MNATAAAPLASETLEFCDWYMREWLPPRLSERDLELLRGVGRAVALAVSDQGQEREWRLLAGEAGLEFLPEGSATACRFRIPLDVFRRIVAGEISPQRAFFTGKLSVEGNGFLALKIGSLLESIFQRSPFDWDDARRERAQMAALVQTAPAPAPQTETPQNEPLSDRQRTLLALHLDAREGSAWWIERAQALGVRPEDFQTLGDLAAFGPMDREAMARRSFRDFLPRERRENPRGLILGETGGTTGQALTMAWTRDDFERAFVDPLLTELEERGIAWPKQWLFAGPTGPHIIGKAADALAQATTGMDALKVDFDPRWHRRLTTGGTASARHLDHIAAQALAHLRREPADALFITPSLLAWLLRDEANRPLFDGLKLLHFGGQSIAPQEVADFAERLPAACALINGYGNSMFGCVVEHRPEEPLVYRTRPADRLLLSLRDWKEPAREVAENEWGQVMFHRFDESALLLNVFERDEAQKRPDAAMFQPRPPRAKAALVSGAIY